MVNRGVCTEAEATEIANNKYVPLVVEQQRKFESMLESFDVSQSVSLERLDCLGLDVGCPIGEAGTCH